MLYNESAMNTITNTIPMLPSIPTLENQNHQNKDGVVRSESTQLLLFEESQPIMPKIPPMPTVGLVQK